MPPFFIQPNNAWWWFGLLIGIPAAISSLFITIISIHPIDPAAIGYSIVIPTAMAFLMVWLLTKSRYAPERPFTIAGTAFLWGAFISVPFAMAFGTGIGHLTTLSGSTMFGASFGGAVPEEPLKLLCAIAVMYLARHYIWHPAQMIVIGMAVGLGFDLNENLSYGSFGALIDPNNDTQAVLSIWGLRLVVGPFAHMIWTGISAWGIGQFFLEKKTTGLGWLFFSLAIHFLFNTQWPFDVWFGPDVAEPASISVAMVWYLFSVGVLIWIYRGTKVDYDAKLEARKANSLLMPTLPTFGDQNISGPQAGYTQS